jgi:DNA-directed RNA polymerase specialized sigma24 family protein
MVPEGMSVSVADFEVWLHREAYRVGGDFVPHDDLVQEGRIEMWRTLERRGPHAGFMTQDAARRMREIARSGAREFGNEGKRGPGSVRDAISFDLIERPVEPEQADLADQLVLAYHRGEIRQAIDALPPRQRAAAIKLLTDGVLTAQERAAWVDARRKLQAELAHLKGC